MPSASACHEAGACHCTKEKRPPIWSLALANDSSEKCRWQEHPETGEGTAKAVFFALYNSSTEEIETHLFSPFKIKPRTNLSSRWEDGL